MRHRILALVAGLSLVALSGMQMVPVERRNALGAGDPDAPREVQWILRRACYDCHSTETRWPIWAYVAPFSWAVVADVEKARARLNFSDWQALPAGERVAMRSLVHPVVAMHRMPLWYYVTLHPDAELSEADKIALSDWSSEAAAELVRPITTAVD